MNAPAPFSPRMALVLVASAALLFAALLVMASGGLGNDDANNGGSHAAGRGLNGFAGFARLAKANGFAVTLVRHASGLAAPGLLVLTPPADAKGADIEAITSARRAIGPTLVILPKWRASPADSANPAAKPGWTELTGVQPPRWQGFLDDVSVTARPLPQAGWHEQDSPVYGPLPIPQLVLSGEGDRLVPLVTGDDGRILAAAIGDETPGPYPLIVVFEPDLLDNFALAHDKNARLAGDLVERALASRPKAATPAGQIAFDLTLNGLARAPNLLALALTPPYLAATLCLLFAAMAVGWRGFARFGPVVVEPADVALGKNALVASSASLIRRAHRLRLLPAPYIEAARGRISAALGLSRPLGPAAIDAAIDRALASRHTGTDHPLFSQTAAQLLAAQGETELLRAAQALHALERKLTR